VAAADRLPLAALGFGLAGLLCAWTPLSAPFGLVVGLAALLLSVRALARPGRRGVAAGAFAASFAAVALSGVVLALTAGVGRELGGSPVVQTPGRPTVETELDRAAERTRAARDRARSELDALEPHGAPAPARDAQGRTR
jgi:hypothetical protein